MDNLEHGSANGYGSKANKSPPADSEPVSQAETECGKQK